VKEQELLAPAVCAECELENGRIPTAEDLSQLQQRARELAKAARAESLSDSHGSVASRDLIPEDVLSEGMLAEYVLGTSELPPVNAVVGGVLANEVLKAVSHKGEPVNNFFFFSLEDNVGLIETLGG
jgi:ubiquitin-like 1-activating enzyme E1 A